MKKSVARQLAVMFISLLVLVMVAMLFANNVFLERFYEIRLRSILIRAYTLVDAHIGEDGIDEDYFLGEFSELERSGNIRLVVLNLNYEPVIGNGESDDVVMAGRLYAYSMGFDNDDAQILEETDYYTIQKKTDTRMGSEFLEIWGILGSSGYHIIMRIPMESIRASARISSEFILYTIVIAILVSIFMIGWMSRRIAKPIRELTILSERMANLDFDARYTSGGENEIGQLGDHFNKMSKTLETTISELKTANNELQRNLDEKIKMDDERREFLSNVSHELKTPLALIQGYAEGLKDCVNDDPESRDYYCDVIIDEAGKMNTLVRKLLTLNQLEFGEDVVEMVRFDLADLIRGKVSSTQILAAQKDAELGYEGPDSLPVWGDEFKVEEVLTNYLSNAINHVEGERKIVIRAVRPEGSGKVRVSVFNTGEGIPEEDLQLVWDKFFKVDKARTRAYGGSGVGLSIVKAIMESFHQAYGVNNVPGGVEFWFELEDAAGNTEEEEQEENDPGQEEQLMRRPAKTPNVPVDAEWVSAEDS